MSRFSTYLRATAGEMRHVKWPTRQQAVVYSALVIAISALVAVFTAGLDRVFTSLLNTII
jgi:preprotein translocase SecE subunit